LTVIADLDGAINSEKERAMEVGGLGATTPGVGLL
jgi:hypothetical protein